MLKAIVVDDEQQGRETIIGVIDNFCEDVAVTGSAASVDEAYTLIRQEPPDVLFLDVEMGTQSGFNLLEQLGEVAFEVIFVTAYDQYAIKAIKFCAIEYLLKPIDLDELKRAIEKVRENLELKSFKRNFQALLGNLRNSRPEEHKIAIPISDGYAFMRVADILYFEADSNYTTVHCLDERPMVVSKTLKYFENLLTDLPFLRIHNSYFVNVKYITKYIRGDGGEVIMDNGSTLSVSRSKKEQLLTALQLS